MCPAVAPASMCILFLTHQWNPEVATRFAMLAAAVGPGQAVVLLDTAKGPAASPEQDGAQVFRFDSRRFADTGYPTFGATMVPGHTHFPLLWYYAHRPAFDYYWAIEYDVAFTGQWRTFFETFSRYAHDFLSCHLRPHADEPEWVWWHTLAHPTDLIPRTRYLRSFNTVIRLSARALAHVHEMHRVGWRGHHEVLLPTLLARGGFSLLDIGGDGAFAPTELRNRHYTSRSTPDGSMYMLGTMRHRPVRARPGIRRGRLYHPVKVLETEAGRWQAVMEEVRQATAYARSRLAPLRRMARKVVGSH